jgi:hypothetical protein
MKIWAYIIMASLGLSVAISAIFLFLWKVIHASVWDKFKPNLKPRDRPQKKIKEETQDKLVLISMFVGALACYLLLYKIVPFWLSILIGAGIGMVGQTIYRSISKSSKEFIIIRELALLYECIELFTKAGFTVRQSLQMSQTVVPHLRNKIRNCIDHWPFGPLRALEKLGSDIGIEQANILVGLLMQIEESGTKNISGAMAQEAVRLEEIREALVESRIAKKPIYSTVYMFLPVASVLGILIAPLAYRAIQMISGLRAGGGM